MGNILLVLGAAMFVGGLRRDRQHFDRTAASAQSSMLLLAAAALVMPAIFELVEGAGCRSRAPSACTTTAPSSGCRPPSRAC